MKSTAWPILISIFLIWGGCAASQPADSKSTTAEKKQEIPKDAIVDKSDAHQSLGDYLRRVPGVTVSNQKVLIRGISSFTSGIEPLFVIDGQVAGTSYTHVNGMINVREIDYVRVLKGTEAAIYGVRGGNGVILIFMKK